MKRLAVIALFLLLEASAFSAAVPAGSVDPALAAATPVAPGASAFVPTPLIPSEPPAGAAAGASAPKAAIAPPAAGPVGASNPAYIAPRSSSNFGIDLPPGLGSNPQVDQLWWFEHEALAPRPQNVSVSSQSSIILFIPDGTGNVQIPTAADLAAGAHPVTFANNSTSSWVFSGKLFESTVGNTSINASHDMDLGIPNQTLTLLFDGAPYDPTGAPIVTSNASGTIFPPFQFANGTFNITVSRFPDLGCGPHVLRVSYDNSSPVTNNASFFASTFKDFVIYITCESTLTVNADHTPATVGDYITFFGEMTGSRTEAVPGRNIQVLMDDKLLGQTGPGAFVDEITLSGTPFSEDFEANGTGWNQSGTGEGTWAVGKPTLPCTDPATVCGPISLPGSQQLAGTGLERFYGKGVDTWLLSPQIDLSNPSVPFPALSFSYWYNISFDDTFEVAFSADGGTTFSDYTPISATAASGFTTSLLDPNGKPTWETRSINVTAFAGTTQLVVGFHLHSVQHTAVTNNQGAFSFRYTLPFETVANYHIIQAKFVDGILLDTGDYVTVATDPAADLFYERSSSITTRIRVLRLSHFEFNLTEEQRIGFRGKSLEVRANLYDNLGQPLVANPAGDNPIEKILIDIDWDFDYNDPFDTPKRLAPDLAPSDAPTGFYKIGYVVDVPQPLGLHNVTYTFKGADFYAPITGQDVYRVMGHTYAIWPPAALQQVFRFSNVTVNGTMRVIPSESRLNKVLGDPVDGEVVQVTWKGEPIPPGQVGVLTDAGGNYFAQTFVPFDEELGKKNVVLTYEGSDIYTSLQSATNWSVVSRTTLLFENTSVYKGSYLYFNGSMLDDRGIGVANQTLTLFLDNETVQVITTNSDGTFTYPHFIPTDMTVGAKQVFIRFAGNPIYLNSSLLTFVAVKAHTKLERTDHIAIVDRGKRLNVSGEIYEVYEGGVRGAPVAFEQVQIRIQDVPLTVETSNSEGKFTFKSNVPAALPVGEATMFFEYPGSDYFDPIANQTQIVIRGQSVVAFDPDQCFVNGAAFNVTSDKVAQKQEVECVAYVTDELGNPIASGDFRAFYAVQTGAGVLSEKIFISAGPVDELGRFKLNVTWDDFVVGNRTIIGEFNGSFCPTFISPRTLCLRPGAGNLTLQYQYVNIPPPPAAPELLIIAIIAIAAILGSAAYFFWYAAKRRQLQKMQRIIRRAADRLVAGNPYAQVIFDAYRALARFLQANGYLRRDSETFREFETALRQALPIDAKSMDEFLSILEEARYSDHEIGEAQKDRAIASLNAVKSSIEQIVASGGMMAPPSGAPAPAPPPAEELPSGEASGARPPGESP